MSGSIISTRPEYAWVGADCPPEYRRVGSIDVADPADVSWALDRDYRIGAIYDGNSYSVAEPCAADIYEEIRCEHCDGTGDVHSIDGEWRGVCTCPAGRSALSLPSEGLGVASASVRPEPKEVSR